MEKFPIRPEDCLILKALRDTKSLREAALLLGCDPAGLARRVQQISADHGFLQKVENRWVVTERGFDLIAWAESSIQGQKKILSAKSSLRIGTTMWFSEEVLIPQSSSAKDYLGDKIKISISVPGKGFEMSLIDGSVDFVVVCHPPENPEIEHRPVADEKWVIIAPKAWQKDLKLKDEELLEELKTRNFIRHSEMNPDLFIPGLSELCEADLTIDNLIGIRKAVGEELGWSLVPKILVQNHFKDQKIIELSYDIPIRDRKVCVWWLRNRVESKKTSGRLVAWVKSGCA